MSTTRIELLTPQQAADFLNLRPQTLACWRSSGKYNLRFVKVGQSIRYRMSDLEKFLEDRCVSSTGEAEAL